MKKILRIVLMTLVLLSSLLVPYSFFAYICYAGICGGEAIAHERIYANFYLNFCWIYILIILISLRFSNQAFKKKQFNRSIIILLLPFLSLIPLLYVEYHIFLINAEYKKLNPQQVLLHLRQNFGPLQNRTLPTLKTKPSSPHLLADQYVPSE